MCGILAVVHKDQNQDSADLIKASAIIRHRGPDDEGFMTWAPGSKANIWAGKDAAATTIDFWKLNRLQPQQTFKVGFAHRRLSIIDLSPRGFQPMVHEKTGVSLIFNGEIYNFPDIKAELESLGHQFESHSDTEVLLLAWVQWGEQCINKLNGMFAFVILDPRKGSQGTLYAVRDRFGVKPVYWSRVGDSLIFCSEIKQIRLFRGYKLNLNRKKVNQYLGLGLVDTDDQTFDNQVFQMRGGSYATVDLADAAMNVKIARWYTLKPRKWQDTDEKAVDKFRNLLQDSVKLRLRADVPVGSCLSGGLDSSAIVSMIKRILDELDDHNGQETVTACYSEKRFDEWNYASDVVNQTGARSHRVFPDFERLQRDADKLLWHQDDPFPSTSMFSQWCVFSCAAEASLKVMVDGQGSDEQLSGYGGNDTALYAGLVKSMKIGRILRESKAYKAKNGVYPVGFILGGVQSNLPKWTLGLFPKKYLALKPTMVPWLNAPAEDVQKPRYGTLSDYLQYQLLHDPLPSLLRFEDRSSMAFSIESRVPFLDYRLVEFNLGLPEHLVYGEGTKKVILRRALKGIMPDSIVNRKDKLGFATPEETWLREAGTQWFREKVDYTITKYPEFFHRDETLKMLEDMIAGRIKFDFKPWRIICFGKWLDMMEEYR